MCLHTCTNDLLHQNWSSQTDLGRQICHNWSPQTTSAAKIGLVTPIFTGKTPCKYGPVFAPYLHNWTLYGINTVQKWVCIYMAFFLCLTAKTGSPANLHDM